MERCGRAIRWLGLLVGVLALQAGLRVSPAAAVALYTVSDIAVDVTAASAVEARNRALEEAKRRALDRLLRRLTLPEDWGRLPMTETLEVEPLVAGIAVDEEKLSATRYVARITVRFDGAAVQRLLREAGIAAVLRPSDPLLVLPVTVQEDGTWRAFAAEDPWRAAWLEEGVRNTLLTLVFPLGDIADVAALATMGEQPTPAVMETFRRRYGTRAVVLAEARVVARLRPPPAAEGADGESAGAGVVEGAPAADGSVPAATAETRWPPRELDVVLVPFGDWPGDVRRLRLRAISEEEAPRLWRVAVRRAMDGLELDWKRHDIVRIDRRAQVVLVLPLAELGEWVQIRRTLEAAPEVRRLVVERVSRREIRFSVDILGGRQRLVRLAADAGFEVVPEGDVWLLRRAAEAAVR